MAYEKKINFIFDQSSSKEMSSHFSTNDTLEEDDEEEMILTQTQFIFTQEECEIIQTQPDFSFSRTQTSQFPFSVTQPDFSFSRTQIFTPIPTLIDYQEEKTPDKLLFELDISVDEEIEEYLQQIEENWENTNSKIIQEVKNSEKSNFDLEEDIIEELFQQIEQNPAKTNPTNDSTFDLSQLEICSLPSQFDICFETPTKPVQQKKEEILTLSSTPSTSSSINSFSNQVFPNFSPLTDDKFLMNCWGIPNEIIHSYYDLGIKSLYPWQVGCLEISEVTEGGENLVYSGPTGGIIY
jgi:hypothetical protein